MPLLQCTLSVSLCVMPGSIANCNQQLEEVHAILCVLRLGTLGENVPANFELFEERIQSQFNALHAGWSVD